MSNKHKFATITTAFIKNDTHLNLAKAALNSFPKDSFRICVINHVYNNAALEELRKLNNLVISNKHNIQAKGWNMGIQSAISWGYDKFFIGSHDIILSDNYCSALLETIKNQNAGIASGVAINRHLSFASYHEKDITEPIVNHDQSFAAFMIDLQTIKTVGYFSEVFKPNYFEDDDYLYRANKKGVKCVRTHKTSFYHMVQATIKTDIEEANKYNKYFQKNKQLYIHMHGGLPGNETK